MTFPPDGFRTSSSNRIFEPCNRDPFEDKMKKKQFIFHPFFSFFLFPGPPFLISRASIFFFLIFFLAFFYSLTRSVCVCVCERERDVRSVVVLVQSVSRSRSRSFNFLLYGGAGGGGRGFAFIFTVLFLSFFLVEFPKSLDKTIPACTPGQAFSSRASTWQEGSSTKKDGSLLCSCLDRIGAFPCCPAQPLSSVPPEEHRFATDHPQVWETNGSLNLVPICKAPVGCMHGVMPSMLLSSNGFNRLST